MSHEPSPETTATSHHSNHQPVGNGTSAVAMVSALIYPSKTLYNAAVAQKILDPQMDLQYSYTCQIFNFAVPLAP